MNNENQNNIGEENLEQQNVGIESIGNIQSEVPTNGSISNIQPEVSTNGSISNIQPEVPTNGSISNIQPEVPANDSQPKVEPPKKKSIGLIIGVFIAIVIIGLLALLPKFLFTGKKAVEKEVTTIFTSAKEALTENKESILDYDLDKDVLGMSGVLTIDSDYKASGIDLTKLKNYKINYQSIIDKKGNQASAKLNLVKNSSNLIGVDGYVSGKDTLISLGDVYDKVITTKLEKEIKDMDFSKNQDTKDIETLIEKTEKIVLDSIKDENITKTKEGKYTKVEYKFNTQEMEKDILNAYLKDDEIIKILANLSDKTEKDTKKDLQDTIDRIKSPKEKDDVTATLYLQGFNNELKKAEVVSNESELVVEVENDIYKYSLKEKEKELYYGKYDKKNKEFTLENKDGLKLVSKKNGDNITFNLDYKSGSQAIKVDVDMKNTVNKDSQNNNTVIKLSYKADTENINATITNDLKIEKNKKVEKITTNNNTIDAENINSEEYEKIYTKITEKLQELTKDIMPGSTEMPDFRKLM